MGQDMNQVAKDRNITEDLNDIHSLLCFIFFE